MHLAALLGLAGFAAILMRGAPHHHRLVVIFLPLYALAAGILLTGGTFGLAYVPSNAWGGLLLTVIVAAWSIATALPIGLVLALARRSDMPVIAAMAGGFIDLVRGLPLVGVLFLAIVMFPLFVPPGIETDKLIRALIAFTVFEAATLAEVFRGGLQGVPKEQIEAGASLGLSHSRITWLVVVPQAITIALPGIVNVCITIIKETTIVLIVGLFDSPTRNGCGRRRCEPPPMCWRRPCSGASASGSRATASRSRGAAIAAVSGEARVPSPAHFARERVARRSRVGSGWIADSLIGTRRWAGAPGVEAAPAPLIRRSLTRAAPCMGLLLSSG